MYLSRSSVRNSQSRLDAHPGTTCQVLAHSATASILVLLRTTMSMTEIEIITKITVPQTVDNVNERRKTPIEDASNTDVKLQDTPTTSPEPVHPAGDLELSLEVKVPPVENPYSPANSMSDLPCVAYALELFLASHMLESEDYLDIGDPQK